MLDGDTLKIGVEHTRLQGIDTPESKQICRAGCKIWRCGASATWALLEHLASRLVAGAERDRERYGRIVAVCRLAGEALKAWMVESTPATAPVRSASVRCPRERMWSAMRSRSLCARALRPSRLPRDGQHGMPTEGRVTSCRSSSRSASPLSVIPGAISVYGCVPESALGGGGRSAVPQHRPGSEVVCGRGAARPAPRGVPRQLHEQRIRTRAFEMALSSPCLRRDTATARRG